MFVHSAVDDAGLSLKAFRVLGHLHRRAGKGDYAWPGVETMADATGLNGKTVKRALKELVAAGFIIREPRKGTSTAYRLVKPPVETGEHDAGETGKRRGPEIGLGQKVTQPKEGPRDGAKNGPGVAQKMAHKDNPIKETKEEDRVFISLNACGVIASTADEAPAPLSPPPDPPDPPDLPATASGPPFPTGNMTSLRKPPQDAQEEFATAGSLVPVPEPLKSAASFNAAWESFCRHRLHLWRLNRTPWTREAAGSLLEKCLRHGASASLEAIGRTVESGKWTGLYFDAGGAGRANAQAQGQSPSGTRPRPAVATLRDHMEVPILENPFTESRRNRDRLRREQEGDPPPGWDGNDGPEPQFQPQSQFQPQFRHREAAAA